MSRIRLFALLTALCCVFSLVSVISAAEVESGSVYCFTPEDFSTEEAPLAGICITQLPDAGVGTVMLGTRVLRPGDKLPSVRELAAEPGGCRRHGDLSAHL